jgi:hypothetical protein
VTKFNLLVALLVACSGDEATKDTTVVPTEPEPEPTNDSGTAPPTEARGSIWALRVSPDPFAPDEGIFGFSTFVEDDLGSINYMGCLFDGFCFTDLGATGGDPLVVQLTANPSFLDGGDVTLGPITIPASVDVGQADPFPWPTAPESIEIAGGDDLAAYSGPEEMTFPILELTSPAVSDFVEMLPGAPLEITWTPGTEGDILITVFSRTGVTFIRTEDDGSATVPANDFAFAGKIDAVSVTVARVLYGGDTIDDLAGFTWWAEDRSILRLDFRNTGETRELASTEWSEDCAGLTTVPSLVPGEYVVDTTGTLDDMNLELYNDLTYFETAGGEVFLPIDLLPGQTLDVSWLLTFGDAAVYLLTDACDPANGLTGSDGVYNNEEEEISYTATATETVILVLDSWDFGSPGLVNIEVN